jgi:hypothetical protein
MSTHRTQMLFQCASTTKIKLFCDSTLYVVFLETIFLLIVYICIAVGDLIIKRRGVFFWGGGFIDPFNIETFLCLSKVRT